MLKKERAKKITDILFETYPNSKCSLDFSTPHELLVAVQLSAQCTDARVNIVTKELFKRYRSTEDFANADLSELCDIIRPCGFYKNKGKNIIASSKKLLSLYDGVLPDNMDDLLKLDGVGRKTANLILGDVFKKPAVVVDTHAIRLTNRFGLTKQKDPVKIEFELKKLIEPDLQSGFCHRLVDHGRAVCTARKADCAVCTVSEYCKKTGVKK